MGSILGRWGVVGMLAVVCASLALAKTLVSHQRTELKQELSRVDREEVALQEELGRLQMEFSMLTRSERLRRVAANELGMASPHPSQVVRP